MNKDELAQLIILLDKFQKSTFPKNAMEIEGAWQAVFDAGIAICGSASLFRYEIWAKESNED